MRCVEKIQNVPVKLMHEVAVEVPQVLRHEVISQVSQQTEQRVVQAAEEFSRFVNRDEVVVGEQESQYGGDLFAALDTNNDGVLSREEMAALRPGVAAPVTMTAPPVTMTAPPVTMTAPPVTMSGCGVARYGPCGTPGVGAACAPTACGACGTCQGGVTYAPAPRMATAAPVTVASAVGARPDLFSALDTGKRKLEWLWMVSELM
eukprot:g3007.t1